MVASNIIITISSKWSRNMMNKSCWATLTSGNGNANNMISVKQIQLVSADSIFSPYEKCPPYAHIFEHLVSRWWCCLWRLWNLEWMAPHWRKHVTGGWLSEFVASPTSSSVFFVSETEDVSSRLPTLPGLPSIMDSLSGTVSQNKLS